MGEVFGYQPPFLVSSTTTSTDTMRVSTFITSLALAHGAFASCGWKLKANDCICMNSVDGSLMDDETATCCRNMGLRTMDNVRDENHT
jgi:hypothetical protein